MWRGVGGEGLQAPQRGEAGVALHHNQPLPITPPQGTAEPLSHAGGDPGKTHWKKG